MFALQGCFICLTLALGWALASYVRYYYSIVSESGNTFIVVSMRNNAVSPLQEQRDKTNEGCYEEWE